MLSNIVAHPIRSALIVLALMIAFGATPGAVSSVGHAIVLTGGRTVGVGVSLIPDAPKGFKQGLDAGRAASGSADTNFAGTAWSGGTSDVWRGGGTQAPAQPNTTPAAQQAKPAPAAKTAAEKKAARKARAKARAERKKRAAAREYQRNTDPA